MSILWLPLIALTAGFLGFILRSSQLKKCRHKITSLENEMLQNHAEILNLQKEIVRLQTGIQNSKTPVVHIKDAAGDEKGNVKGNNK